MRKRLNIGLMISEVENDFANAVCRGAIVGAKEIDANLFIFPGRYIDASYADKKRTEYEYQYNTLFSYAFPDDIDVLLVLVGAICGSISYERKIEFLRGLGDIPIITLASEVEGFSSVCFDNTSGLKDCIEHIINVHKCEKIGFVSGPSTNNDALERLEIYKKTLENNGIAYDENRVAYGNFSPYSQDTVRELLKKCPDLEAICFANDSMAEGAYDVFEEMGLEPGRDILVTGFDDSPVASTLMPPLTTVSADASELGYGAVLECKKAIGASGITHTLVPSTMVKRRSCGCKSDNYASVSKNVFSFNGHDCVTDSQTVSVLVQYLFSDYKSSNAISKVKSIFTTYLNAVFTQLASDDAGHITYSEKAAEYISSGLEDLLTSEMMKYVGHDRVCTVVDYLGRRFLAGLDNPWDREKLRDVFVNLYKIIMRASVSYSDKRIGDIEFLTFQANSITKDMLLFESYDDEGYGTVTDKFMRMNMDSSYIYVFPETITNQKEDKWMPPSTVLLKSYHNGDKMEVVDPENQEISIEHLFDNKYIPDDRRVTMVLSAIFLNTDHYGLFLCEMDYDYFYYINILASQLCAAMKILRLIQDRDAIHAQLQETLENIKLKNLQLDAISKIDELTGVYNRRGFFYQANELIYSPMNAGKSALIIFADLDSLKTINDSFSHEDGDFAIKNAARILSDSFRSSDVIGRIGGDEFSVLAMVDGGNCEEVISGVRSRIKAQTESFNKSHDRPFIVRMSVGVYSFKCGNDIELSKILAQADTVLYDEKKKKRSILRKDNP